MNTYLVTVNNTDGSTRIVRRLANTPEAAKMATGHNKGDKVISAELATDLDNLVIPAAWVTKRPNATKVAKVPNSAPLALIAPEGIKSVDWDKNANIGRNGAKQRLSAKEARKQSKPGKKGK